MLPVLSVYKPESISNIWKYGVLLCLISLILFGYDVFGGLGNLIASSLADAFIQVTSFVALTLYLFDTLERRFKINPAKLLQRHPNLQPFIAACLGALPGCGGAIIVITQFVIGRIGFGGMVSVLTSTMGDAAFLLLARDPQAAILVFSISIVAGTIAGTVVDKIHGRDFLKASLTTWDDFRVRCGTIANYKKREISVWYGLVSIAVVFGIATAFQIDTDKWFGSFAKYEPTKWFGCIGALYCLLLWARTKRKMVSLVNLAAHPACKTRVKWYNRIILDTTFVTSWVIVAFLSFEILIHMTGFNLEHLFDVAAPLVPLIAVLIGFIPGCGPQVILTTLYLTGIAPFSAQIGNAISNDGDALFPAIALAPKAALLATLYTSIPALIIAYGWFFLFE